MGQRKGYCSIVDADCLAPAGFGTTQGYAECDPGPIVTCGKCFADVCRGCSMLYSWNKRRRRICHNCIEEIEGRVFLLDALAKKQSQKA